MARGKKTGSEGPARRLSEWRRQCLRHLGPNRRLSQIFAVELLSAAQQAKRLEKEKEAARKKKKPKKTPMFGGSKMTIAHHCHLRGTFRPFRQDMRPELGLLFDDGFLDSLFYDKAVELLGLQSHEQDGVRRTNGIPSSRARKFLRFAQSLANYKSRPTIAQKTPSGLGSWANVFDAFAILVDPEVPPRMRAPTLGDDDVDEDDDDDEDEDEDDEDEDDDDEEGISDVPLRRGAADETDVTIFAASFYKELVRHFFGRDRVAALHSARSTYQWKADGFETWSQYFTADIDGAIITPARKRIATTDLGAFMIAEYKRYEYNHTKVKNKVELQESAEAMAFVQSRHRADPAMKPTPFVMVSLFFLDLVLTRVTYSQRWLDYCAKGSNKVDKSRLKEEEMFQMERIGRWPMNREDKIWQASALLGALLLQEIHKRDPRKR